MDRLLAEPARRRGLFRRSGRRIRRDGTQWRRGADSNPRYRELTYARNLRGLGVLFDPNKSVCAGEKFVSQKFGCISALSGSLLYVRMTRLLE
jgi:hypothetical protein